MRFSITHFNNLKHLSFQKQAVYFSIFLVLTITLYSCSPKLSMTIASNETGTLEFKTETDSSVESAVRSLLNAPEGTLLFDADSVLSSLIESGVKITKLSFPSVAGLQFEAIIPELANALPKIPGAIAFEKNTASAGKQKLTITISAEILKQAVNFMPPETAEYLELLMAPVFTNEEMTVNEYYNLIGTVYGATCAEAMKKAVMQIQITAPSKITDAFISDKSVGTVQINGTSGGDGKTVVFLVPLAAVLTKTSTTTFTTYW